MGTEDAGKATVQEHNTVKKSLAPVLLPSIQSLETFKPARLISLQEDDQHC